MAVVLLLLAPAFLWSGVVLVRRGLRNPHLFVIVLVLALPWGDRALAGQAAVHVASVGVALAVATSAVVLPSMALRDRGVLLTLVLFVASAMLSTITSESPTRSLLVSTTYAFGLGAAWAVGRTATTWEALRTTATALSLVGGAVGCTALSTLSQLQDSLGGNVVEGRATTVFTQPNELGAFCAMTLTLSVGSALSHSARLPRRLCWLASAGCLIGLALSFSRGAWIGAAAGLVVIPLLVPAVRRTAGILVVGALGIVLAGLSLARDNVVITILLNRLESLVDPSNPYDARPAIWAEAIRQVSDSPLFGIGPGAFADASVASGSVLRSDPAAHAHNLVLAILDEQGVVGLAVLVAMVFLVGRTAVRTVALTTGATGGATRLAPLIAGLVAALAAVMGQGLIDQPAGNPIVGTTLWIVLGMTAAAANLLTPRSEDGATAHPDEWSGPSSGSSTDLTGAMLVPAPFPAPPHDRRSPG